MRVRMGWSGETQSGTWQKADVELEQEDLVRIFNEHGLDEQLILRLPTKVCFALLQNEAEQLLLSKLITMGFPPDKANAKTAMLMGATESIVAQIKEKLALV